MPRIKLTKSNIDALPTLQTDVVYWDAGCPGFGVKVTPKGRKVFVVLYRTGGAGCARRDFARGYAVVRLHRSSVRAVDIASSSRAQERLSSGVHSIITRVVTAVRLAGCTCSRVS